MADQQTATERGGNQPYVSHAVRWVGEVILVGILVGFLTMFLVDSGGPPAYLFVVLLNLGSAVVMALLLFRRVDTLILERMAQLEG